MRRKGEKVVILIVVLGLAMMGFQKWHVHQRQLELERDIATKIEVRRMMDSGALDGRWPSELFANPPPVPVDNFNSLPQTSAPSFGANTSPKDFSDQLERDQIRREIEGLKRQADLDRMNRDIQRRDDEQKARRKELEHSLRVDHPQ